jgi:hypothetical protein
MFKYYYPITDSQIPRTHMTPDSLSEVSVADILGEKGQTDDVDSRGIRSMVATYVRLNPDGVTAQMVAQSSGISLTWAKQVLEDLLHQRDVYSRVVPGVRAKLYYPNGKLVHKYLQDSKEIGSQIFRVSVHEGRKSPRVQIQERRFNLLEGEKVEGSIFVDIDNVEGLVTLTRDVLARMNQINATKEFEKE